MALRHAFGLSVSPDPPQALTGMPPAFFGFEASCRRQTGM